MKSIKLFLVLALLLTIPSLASASYFNAVEIKDDTTDTRQKIKTDGVDNAAVVTQNSQPLPAGAATAALQLADGHNVTVDNTVPVTGTFYQVTQPVSAAALPLPAGASTSALQLPDGHDVIANAGTNLNTSALATEATMTADLQSIEDNQTDGTQKNMIVDASGNIIASHLSADGDLKSVVVYE